MVDLERLGREMLAAGLGCAIADGTLNGLEVTKVKMQLDSATEPVYPRSMLGTIRQCVAEDGALRGLCLPGLAATTLRNVLGTRNLAEILSERESISKVMQDALDEGQQLGRRDLARGHVRADAEVGEPVAPKRIVTDKRDEIRGSVRSG